MPASRAYSGRVPCDLFKGKIYGIEPGAGETKLYEDKVQNAYGLKGEYEPVKSNTSAMPAQLDRAYQKNEPIAVTLWSPHWAYDKYDLTRVADPEKTWGANNQIRTLANKGFPEKYSELNGWRKNWHMAPDELMSLEQAIQKAGRGREGEGVQNWIDAHPGIVDEMAPVK
ncbi:hypothetical protein OG250_35960 [Streptomyces sp. NBC_00487]|uniref:glycine betaine ABC transporter substrate-binding protein n=1 Tax=unclassified Streptomyces TaxID=2593676 RepID=UPI002E19F901|nr:MULTISPECIES: glycine betaine ABC transporter substrate-binding protein [unclassified Streptomyces]